MDGRPWLTADAARYIGVSESTVVRRARLYENNDRTSKSLKCGRTSGDTGDRHYDPWDCERARRQRLGLLRPGVTPDMWARIEPGGVWSEDTPMAS